MQRLNHTAASPEGYKKLQAVSAFLAHSGLEASLLELISIRASEINGCA
jgi:alkylhydroperoxidase family enzyme